MSVCFQTSFTVCAVNGSFNAVPDQLRKLAGGFAATRSALFKYRSGTAQSDAMEPFSLTVKPQCLGSNTFELTGKQ